MDDSHVKVPIETKASSGDMHRFALAVTGGTNFFGEVCVSVYLTQPMVLGHHNLLPDIDPIHS